MLDLKNCDLCPRCCGIDRYERVGFCGERATLRIARAALHFWEEPPISGTAGSGTVFFSGCSLRCVYCQNREISHGGVGADISLQELVDRFFMLERQGAHNLNLVTPTHFAPQIMEAVADYRKKGGRLPVIYNTGGYERVEAIEALQGTVDVYLTDLKYASSEAAEKYSAAPDYPRVARAALEKMVALTGPLKIDDAGMLRRGVAVRLLVLPALEHEAMMNLQYLWNAYGNRIIISLMNQYTPVGENLPPELQAPLPDAAYQTVLHYAEKCGFKNIFFQEGETAKESFIPAFDPATLRGEMK